MPSVIKSTPNINDFLSKISDDMGLLVLCTKEGKPDSSVSKLLDMAIPAFEKHFHGLVLRLGTFAQSNAPFAVLHFETFPETTIERRWLASKAFKHLQTIWPNQTSWEILLADEVTDLGAEMAFDFEALYFNPRYLASKVEEIAITSLQKSGLDAVNKNREIRQKYNIEYRKWVNENPDELTSIEIGHRLQKFSEKHGCKFSSLDVPALERLGLNLLLAVGQASQRSPSRLHIVEYKPVNATKKTPIALVGKGVTFDTGGINVKPFESFVNCMKNDMGGSALMSNLFMALVESGFSEPLVLVIPCCENLVAENAMKPGTIIKSYNGKEVFVEHTDAEGRLILADAISYCHELYKPEKTIVGATLTTSALIQFTNFNTAVHFADEDFKNALNQSAEKFGESFTYWNKFLPFLEANYTPAADLTNMGRMPKDASRSGGSMVAAHFLDQFATEPMIHFDIFASTWNWTGCYPGANYGATGAPFNSLFEACHLHWPAK